MGLIQVFFVIGFVTLATPPQSPPPMYEAFLMCSNPKLLAHFGKSCMQNIMYKHGVFFQIFLHQFDDLIEKKKLVYIFIIFFLHKHVAF